MLGSDIEPTKSSRIELRATPQEKALLLQAAALEHLDMSSFIMRCVLSSARAVIEQTERLALSEKDTLLVLELLENPPAPNAKLRAAAKAWSDNQMQ